MSYVTCTTTLLIGNNPSSFLAMPRLVSQGQLLLAYLFGFEFSKDRHLPKASKYILLALKQIT